MLSTYIAITIIVVSFVLWTISTYQRLVMLDENIGSAMSQIGVQVSSRFDALITILNLTKAYAMCESEMMIDTIKSSRSAISAKSIPDDVLGQERVISEAIEIIDLIIKQHPELKTNQTYIKTMGVVQTFDNMMRTSRLIYNDSVSKLNREIRMFPVSMVAGILGFRQRDHLEEQASKEDISDMK